MPNAATSPRPQSTATAGLDLPIAALKHLHRGEARACVSLLLSRRLSAAELVDFLIDARLGVFAQAALAELHLQRLLSGSAAQRLQEQWRQQQERNAALLAELARIEDAWRHAGIDFLLLKGLPLSDRFYGGRGRRFTWDLDLLVHRHDVHPALDSLDRLGFRQPAFTRGLDRLAPRVAHAVECRRADGLAVDLHWSLRVLPGLAIDGERVWRDSRRHTLGPLECRVPSDEHSLLLLLLGIAADLDRSLCRMRSLWDVYLMLDALPDFGWQGFFARCEIEGSIGLVANALALVVHRLDCAAEFPALVQALAAQQLRVTVTSTAQASLLLSRPPHSLANHLVYARWQPLPRWRYAAWWAATLPLRAYFARRV